MLKLSLFDPLKKWTCNGKLGYCVAADVGASGMRLRFCNPENITDFFDLPHAKANCAQDLYNELSIVEKFIQKSSPKAQCFGSAFAIPGIRKGTEITPYNWPEPNSRRTIKTDLFPQRVFPNGHKIILNDLEAGAYGLYQMNQVGNPKKYFRKLYGDDGPIIGRMRTAVMALGSGLGTAILASDPIYKQPIVISTELGYLQVATVLKNHEKYKEEQKLVTDGIYRYIRHPSYLGFYIFAIGTQVFLSNIFTPIAFAGVLWYFFNDRIQYEEFYLIQFFGEKYIQYRNKTPTYLPFIK